MVQYVILNYHHLKAPSLAFLDSFNYLFSMSSALGKFYCSFVNCVEGVYYIVVRCWCLVLTGDCIPGEHGTQLPSHFPTFKIKCKR